MSLLLLLLASQPELGRLSTYRPGPGLEELACGGRYTRSQVHVAHRRWRQLGCGRLVLVCAEQTGRCAVAPVMDSGPWGIRKGKAWRLWVRPGLPKGWRWSAVADLSWGLWRKLGRPRGTIALYTGEKHEVRILRDRVLARASDEASLSTVFRHVLELYWDSSRPHGRGRVHVSQNP